MSLRGIVSLILSLQLAWGNLVTQDDGRLFTSDPPHSSAESRPVIAVNSTPHDQDPSTARKEVTQQPSNEGQCAWWCDETLGIAIVAGVGAIFLISIILCTVSCCLWRRKRKHPVMKEMELEALTQNVTAERSVTLPGDNTEPPPISDNGICDVEKCTSENTQDAQDMANNMSSSEFNLPEPPDMPPLAE